MKSRIVLSIGAALATATLTALPVTTAQAGTPSSSAPSAPSAPSAKTAGHAKVINRYLSSVPDPGRTAKVNICYSLFRPASATKHHRVPMIMHSHGWGGSRTTDPAAFKKFFDAGYAVLSFDQRGFGESGGQAYVENPTVEGHDVRKLVRRISKLHWVKQDGKGDPRLGAIGGSYGGGYQFLGAFEELRLHGKPIFDALAPEITWFDLHQSLAPDNVVRTAWATALTAAAAPTDAMPQQVLTGFAEGAATGTWPDGSSPTGTNLNPFFKRNGPKWHVDHGRKLNIPVLFGQGTTDSLFPLEQGLANWKKSITRHARKHSIFVGYNGGHVLPALTPPGIDVTSDPCSKALAGGTFEHLSIRFFNEQLKHRHTGLKGYGRYHLATPDSTCTTVRSVRPDKAYDVGTVATTETGGVPLSYAVAKGPIKIAGSSYLTAKMTALGVNNRAFYGLAVGTSPVDAHLVQNNVLPINEAAPVIGEKRRVALPSAAIDVPRGETLYLLATPISDTFVGMGSRTPGAVILDNTVVHLPVVGR